MFLNVTRTAHPIGNSTFTAPTDTTLDGVFLARGTQLTKPVNLDPSWNANLFAAAFPAALHFWLVTIHSPDAERPGAGLIETQDFLLP